jgi:undecaprenyl-diphosphatase
MDEIIKIVAKYFVVIPVLVNLYIFWQLKSKDRKHMFIWAVALAILSLVIAKIGSHLYYDTRPQFKDGATPLFAHSNDNGFPSDHTLLASFLAFLALKYSKPAALGLFIVAALIGWARIAAHVHHLIDIVGSFVAAGVAYLIALYLFKVYFKGNATK